MLNIDEIQNGIVIDHIKAGTSRTLADIANLDSLECSVAMIRNVRSTKSGKKDIIKIEGNTSSINFGILAYKRKNSKKRKTRSSGNSCKCNEMQ